MDIWWRPPNPPPTSPPLWQPTAPPLPINNSFVPSNKLATIIDYWHRQLEIIDAKFTILESKHSAIADQTSTITHQVPSISNQQKPKHHIAEQHRQLNNNKATITKTDPVAEKVAAVPTSGDPFSDSGGDGPCGGGPLKCCSATERTAEREGRCSGHGESNKRRGRQGKASDKVGTTGEVASSGDGHRAAASAALIELSQTVRATAQDHQLVVAGVLVIMKSRGGAGNRKKRVNGIRATHASQSPKLGQKQMGQTRPGSGFKLGWKVVSLTLVGQAQFNVKAMQIFVLLFKGSSKFFRPIKQWDPGGNFYIYLIGKKN